jgi:hypothetical protein
MPVFQKDRDGESSFSRPVFHLGFSGGRRVNTKKGEPTWLSLFEALSSYS